MDPIYSNKEEKRLMKIFTMKTKDLKNSSTPIGYLNKNGSLIEYVMSNIMDCIDTCKDNSYPIVDERWKRMKEFDYDGYIVYLDEGKINTDIYIQIPKIISDHNFTWKTNTYGSLRATIKPKDSAIEFDIHVCKDNTAYVKCYHKNYASGSGNIRRAFDSFYIYDASNEDILKGIETWREQFRRVV